MSIKYTQTLTGRWCEQCHERARRELRKAANEACQLTLTMQVLDLKCCRSVAAASLAGRGASAWVACVGCVCGVRLWGAFVGCVCGVRVWGAFVGCVCGVRVWGAFVGCVCGLRVWGACVGCVCGVRLWGAFVGCVCGLRLWAACVGCVCGVRLWIAFVGCVCGVRLWGAFVGCADGSLVVIVCNPRCDAETLPDGCHGGGGAWMPGVYRLQAAPMSHMHW